MVSFELCSDLALHMVQWPSQILRRKLPTVIFTGQLGHLHHPSAQEVLHYAVRYYDTVIFMPKTHLPLEELYSGLHLYKNWALVNPNVTYDLGTSGYTLVNQVWTSEVQNNLKHRYRKGILAHQGSSMKGLLYKSDGLLSAVLLPCQYPLYATRFNVGQTLYVSCNPNYGSSSSVVNVDEEPLI